MVKYTTIILLSIISTVVLGALIKSNADLNKFIQHDNREASKTKIKSTINGTEVHIIGTVHFETDSVKRLDLHDLIADISPSVILFESDEKTLKRILRKRDYFFQLRDFFKGNKSMEKSAVLKYIDQNPSCKVLPYEWEDLISYRHKHKLKKKPGELINSIIELKNENLLSSSQSSIMDEFLLLNSTLSNLEQGGTLAVINSPKTDSIVRQRQNYVYKKVPEIANDRKELSKYADFLPIHMGYWDKRNKAMVQNILNQIKLNPNKVIVVLNGFSHRYYLLDELKKYQAENGFTIIDR